MTRRLAWAGFAAAALLVIGGLALMSLTPAGRIPAVDDPGPLAGEVALGLTVLVFALVGALVAARMPRNPVGWLLCAVGVLNGIWFAGTGWARYTVYEDPGALPAAAELAWLAGVANDVQWAVLILALLLFPDGRLPSRGWLVAVGLVVVLNAGELVLSGLQPGPLEEFSSLRNPLGMEGAGWMRDVDFDIGANLLLLVAVAGLLVKRRRATPEMRRQLRAFLFALALVALAIAGIGTVQWVTSSETVAVVGASIVVVLFVNLAVTLGVAVLKHRLYDVDLVIRRTLVYGALTATLGAIYLALVLLSGLAVGESDLAVATATLAVAGLFRPALTRIQAVVDRRFYRRRYDAAQTLAEFGARLRDQIDLEALGADLRGVVRETVQPAHVSLWLRSPR